MQQKKIIINFIKANIKFGQAYIRMVVRVTCRTKICNFKAKDNISWDNLCLGSISKDFTIDEQK